MTTDYDSDETQTDEAPPMSLGNLPSELLLGCCSFLEYFDQIESTATIAFDKTTGNLRYIFTGFLDRDVNCVPDSVLRMLLHGLCDEAVR